jgi:hypothetical protein
MRKLIVGNWKMHGVSADLAEITPKPAESIRMLTRRCAYPRPLLRVLRRFCQILRSGRRIAIRSPLAPIRVVSLRRCWSMQGPK